MYKTYPQVGEKEKGRKEGEEIVREREYYKTNGIQHYQ